MPAANGRGRVSHSKVRFKKPKKVLNVMAMAHLVTNEQPSLTNP